jgi:hypothetical protein
VCVDLSSFIGVLQDCAEALTSVGEVIDLLSTYSDLNEPDAKLKLQRLQREFSGLQRKHVDAVMDGNILLAHECRKNSRRSEGSHQRSRSEAGSIGARCEEPACDSTRRAVGDLHRRTEDRLRALDY